MQALAEVKSPADVLVAAAVMTGQAHACAGLRSLFRAAARRAQAARAAVSHAGALTDDEQGMMTSAMTARPLVRRPRAVARIAGR